MLASFLFPRPLCLLFSADAAPFQAPWKQPCNSRWGWYPWVSPLVKLSVVFSIFLGTTRKQFGLFGFGLQCSIMFFLSRFRMMNLISLRFNTKMTSCRHDCLLEFHWILHHHCVPVSFGTAVVRLLYRGEWMTNLTKVAMCCDPALLEEGT